MRRAAGLIALLGAFLGVVTVAESPPPADAQCAPGPLLTFEGIATSYEAREAPKRYVWTFRVTVPPAGRSLPDNVAVAIAHDPPDGSATSVEGSLGAPVRAGARYRLTVQELTASDGTVTFGADACGGSYELLAEPTSPPTTKLFGGESPSTTISAEHAARSTWKFLLGAMGILAVVGGVLRTATGRRRR